jgi:peptidoglycan/xylan/chitin deacetylase (PgdA/CDA1 family)
VPGDTLLLHSVDRPARGIHSAESLVASLAGLIGRCAITVDDGFAHTLPAVRRLADAGHDVTLFVCGWLLEGPVLPKDRLQRLVASLPRGALVRVGPLSARILSNDRRYRAWLGFRLNRALMEVVGPGRYALAIEAACAAHPDVEDDAGDVRLADAADLRALRDAYPAIRFGAHGHSHYRMDRLVEDEPAWAVEVDGARRRLESALGVAIDAVAPPYGLTSPATNARLSRQFRSIHLLDDRAAGERAARPVHRIPCDWLQLVTRPGEAAA